MKEHGNVPEGGSGGYTVFHLIADIATGSVAGQSPGGVQRKGDAHIEMSGPGGVQQKPSTEISMTTNGQGGAGISGPNFSISSDKGGPSGVSGPGFEFSVDDKGGPSGISGPGFEALYEANGHGSGETFVIVSDGDGPHEIEVNVE